MRLYHPYLDSVIERTPRQAEVLAESGWVPVDQPPFEPDAPDPPDLSTDGNESSDNPAPPDGGASPQEE